MKLFLVFFISLFSSLACFAQVQQTASTNKGVKSPGKTYALVIGIATYENKNIPNLNFPNKDAAVFAQYLQSKAGGAVPAENIRLLVDTNATTAAIYNALDWLRDQCQTDKEENDKSDNLIYFYFSGHGDMETQTMKELGFLLSYNTPGNNYINNAVRLEDLNYYANTLSVKFNAKVVIISDACHSGKLAGSDHQGKYLVGKELSTAKANEIRIASCAPEELSQENIAWGGGRGIFSYYLVNGLKGLADRNSDSIITLNEIQKYLDSSISNDVVMKENRLKQNPILKGNDNFKMAVVEKQEFLAMQRDLAIAQPVQSNQDYFLSLLTRDERLELLDYTKLKALSKDEIAFELIRPLAESPDTTIQRSKLAELVQSLRNNKAALQSFNENIAAALHTYGQKVINLYLQGDEAELEKRRYYNNESSGYDMYPAMYALALQLTEADNPLSRILQINQNYFTGVALRLKIPTVDEGKQDALITAALIAQKKAIELEENAAYVQNELGILYQAKKDYTQAEKYFNNAILLAPAWAIPVANLSGLYARTKNFDKSIKAGEKANELQPGLQLTNTNLGVANELSGNLLFAEEFYRTAIDINSRHYFPFERLGFTEMNTTHYAEADSFFHEAELRKKGYHFKPGNAIAIPDMADLEVAAPFFCRVDTLVLKKDDIMAFFTWGFQEYQEGDYINAERIFKKIVALDKKNPIVFHYLGKIFYDQKKWEAAEVMFKLAVRYHLDSNAFDRYSDSVIKSVKYPYEHECFETTFTSHHYQAEEDHYFMAKMYESWAHYEEAEEQYRTIIQSSPAEIGGYVKYWKLMEKLGRYAESEKLIQSYAVQNKELTDRELNAFYRRAINQFPENGDWYHKLGLLLYDRIGLPSKTTYLDTIIWFPKLNNEVFIDLDSYDKLGEDLRWDVAIKGAPELVKLHNPVEMQVTISTPGTWEQDSLAPIIYTPRKDAIGFLIKADSLLTGTETKADINFKIGNVFVRAGSKKQAYAYYNKSVQLVPDNAGARLSLINTARSIYKNRMALEQLNYLYDNKQINFPDRMLLAEFSIHAGQFEKAKKILKEAQSIYPYVLPEIDELQGRLYLLAAQPKLAIPFYKKLSAADPKDPATLYTIARLYIQSGNTTEAWKWLETALNNGFNYSYVLNNDPSWTELRKIPKWTVLLQRVSMKEYKDPEL